MERDCDLPLIDNNGDPKLPVFLYDLELMDSSMTKGLFRGRLLVAVITSPPEAERP